MKFKVIREYRDTQLGRLVHLNEIIDVKSKKRGEQLTAAGVAVVVEDNSNGSA